MASTQTADGQYWARILALSSQGHSYAHIAAKLTDETKREWKPEGVRSVVRQTRMSTDVAGIPPLGNIIPKDNPLMKGEKRILILSDLHEPDSLPIVDHIIKEHRGWDGIHFNGDFFNMDYVSSHSSNVVTPIEVEFRKVHKRLESCEGYFDECLVSPGNHEWRLKWYFDKHVDRALKPIIKKQTDPLTFVVGGFSLTDDAGKDVHYRALPFCKVMDWWFTRFGDAIVAHPHDFLRLPMRTVSEFDAYFRDWNMQHRCLIIGHTHKSGSLWTDTFPKRLLIESGCLTKTHDYQVRNGKRYRPQSVGYVELALWNGEVDLERTRQVQIA